MTLLLGSGGTTWPAPPSSAPWQAIPVAAAVHPATATARRSQERAPDRRPIRTGRIARRASRPALRDLCGIASRFCLPHEPTIDTRRHPDLDGAQVLFQPDAFDHSLRAILRGRAAFSLCVAHEEKDVLATSDDGCLSLWRQGDVLRLRVWNDTPAGRAAIRLIHATGFHELSLGLSQIECKILRNTNHVPLIVVGRATIVEVSIVPEAGCPGCGFDPS